MHSKVLQNLQKISQSSILSGLTAIQLHHVHLNFKIFSSTHQTLVSMSQNCARICGHCYSFFRICTNPASSASSYSQYCTVTVLHQSSKETAKKPTLTANLTKVKMNVRDCVLMYSVQQWIVVVNCCSSIIQTLKVPHCPELHQCISLTHIYHNSAKIY